jgi:3-hydroxyisobutyrate dehydrogenase
VPINSEATPSVQVGVLGAGRMGRPIIGHLVRAGYPALVYDPNEETRTAVEAAGARFTTTTGEIAADCAVILVCVGYEEQVAALLTGEAALLGAMRPGTVVAVLSTISPGQMTSLAKEAAPFGVHLIDAPVCRGGGAADRGELLSRRCCGRTPRTWCGPGTWAPARWPRRSTT